MAISGDDWTTADKKRGYDEPAQTSDDFAHQRGKPIKAVIGVAVLVVLALVLSRMNPAPHEVSNTPAMTTGQTTGTSAR